MEHGVNHAVSIIIFSFLLLITVGLTSYGIEFAHAIEYKSQVNNQIERQGGLTNQAQSTLKSYSKDHYNNKISVQSSQTKKEAYGTTVEYEIHSEVQFLFFQLPKQMLTVKGSAVSLVR
ncbi:hypothetical protein JI528_14665 [Listeria monocytogenes]|uniref:hypothetical protein n=1 Tax=Listeria monocytogenes TaxID=1639 RepID=UPI001EDD8088|nr:hypothetical protein [Listeria monocytogenes]EAE8116651.1 hypothetical protein [Listeria monocytogenes]EIU8640648.1 hypothetical protein [Listeria monocytogenes]MCG3315175.1 hypothetical protein [Listeria monocytogenes]MCH5071807.1 hypothetical protein [Listeria monocytogenes]